MPKVALPSGNALRKIALDGLLALGLAAAYYLVGNIGLLLDLGNVSVRLMWPPTGAALAALLLLGTRAWPGIALGSFLLNLLSLDRPPIAALAVAAATTIGVLCGYRLMRRVSFRVELDRMRDLAALVVFGAVVGMTVATSLRVGALVLADLEQPANYWARWMLDWISSCISVLTLTPAFLLLPRIRWPRGLRPLRALEAVAAPTAAFLIMLVATRVSIELLFLAFPVLIWAALRFRLAGAAPCVVIVSLMAAVAAANGTGPFAGANVFAKIVTLQAFGGSAALTALVLAVTTTERNRATKEIEHTATELVGVVHQLDRRLRPAVPLPRTPSDTPATGERRVVHEHVRRE
ncbi:MASE1 domain-containing protein [Actinopolymorpha pittospori]